MEPVLRPVPAPGTPQGSSPRLLNNNYKKWNIGVLKEHVLLRFLLLIPPYHIIKYFLRFKPPFEPMYWTVHTVSSTYHIIKHDKYKYCKYSSKFWNISFHERFFITTRYCFFRAVLVQWTCSFTPLLAALITFLDIYIHVRSLLSLLQKISYMFLIFFLCVLIQVLNPFVDAPLFLDVLIHVFRLFSAFCFFMTVYILHFGWNPYLLNLFTFFSFLCIYSFTAAVLTLSIAQA